MVAFWNKRAIVQTNDTSVFKCLENRKKIKYSEEVLAPNSVNSSL